MAERQKGDADFARDYRLVRSGTRLPRYLLEQIVDDTLGAEPPVVPRLETRQVNLNEPPRYMVGLDWSAYQVRRKFEADQPNWD